MCCRDQLATVPADCSSHVSRVPRSRHARARRKAKTARAIFIPEDCRLDSAKLSQLFYECWEIEKNGPLAEPATLISVDAGTVHPSQFASQKLVELPQFSVTYADAKKVCVGSYGLYGHSSLFSPRALSPIFSLPAAPTCDTIAHGACDRGHQDGNVRGREDGDGAGDCQRRSLPQAEDRVCFGARCGCICKTLGMLRRPVHEPKACRSPAPTCNGGPFIVSLMRTDCYRSHQRQVTRRGARL